MDDLKALGITVRDGTLPTRTRMNPHTKWEVRLGTVLIGRIEQHQLGKGHRTFYFAFALDIDTRKEYPLGDPAFEDRARKLWVFQTDTQHHERIASRGRYSGSGH